MSPPHSPNKKAASPEIMSPIFKSDTARAIAKEVGLGDLTLNKNAKSTKKRSLTISGSSPAVTEALNNHQAKVLFLTFSCMFLNPNDFFKFDFLIILIY